MAFPLFLLHVRRPGEPRTWQAGQPPEVWIHLAVVACGNRLEETLVMLKSAVLFSHRKIRFHIFTEESLQPEFDKQVSLWVSWLGVCMVGDSLAVRSCLCLVWSLIAVCPSMRP